MLDSGRRRARRMCRPPRTEPASLPEGRPRRREPLLVSVRYGVRHYLARHYVRRRRPAGYMNSGTWAERCLSPFAPAPGDAREHCLLNVLGVDGRDVSADRPGSTMCERPASALGAPESTGGLGTLEVSRDDVDTVDVRPSGPPRVRYRRSFGRSRPIAANVQFRLRGASSADRRGAGTAV